MIEESKVFSLQLPWAHRLSDVLQEANSWTAAAQHLLVCITYHLCQRGYVIAHVSLCLSVCLSVNKIIWKAFNWFSWNLVTLWTHVMGRTH